MMVSSISTAEKIHPLYTQVPIFLSSGDELSSGEVSWKKKATVAVASIHQNTNC